MTVGRVEGELERWRVVGGYGDSGDEWRDVKRWRAHGKVNGWRPHLIDVVVCIALAHVQLLAIVAVAGRGGGNNSAPSEGLGEQCDVVGVHLPAERLDGTLRRAMV